MAELKEIKKLVVECIVTLRYFNLFNIMLYNTKPNSQECTSNRIPGTRSLVNVLIDLNKLNIYKFLLKDVY